MRSLYFLTGTVLFAASATALAQRVGEVVTIDQTRMSDEYAAGRSIRVTTAIDGDLVAAGREIIVDGPVGGDLIAAGETIEVLQAVRDDVRAAGRIVTIGSSVSGHIVAVGDEIEITPSASVSEYAWIAGRSLVVNGRVNGELRATGERVRVSSEINGDAVVTAEQVEVTETSIIRGDLIVRSQVEPVIAPGAAIEGETIREDPPEGPFNAVRGITDRLYSSVAMLIAAIAVYLVFVRFSASVTNRNRIAPLQSLGIGIGVAVLTPVAIIALFVTGIGYLLGLGVLAAYLLSLLLGALFGLISVSGIGLSLITGPDRAKNRLIRVVALGVTVFALLLLRQIPVVGGVLLFAVVVGGLGALTTELWQKYRLAPS